MPRFQPAAEPEVLLLDEPDRRKLLAHERDRPVRRAVVDDDRLVARDALEALLEPRQRVVRDDDDRHVVARHECSAGTQCGPPHDRSYGKWWMTCAHTVHAIQRLVP